MMYAPAEKPNENNFPASRPESRTVANAIAQKQSNAKQCFGIVDNRPSVTVI